MCSVFKLLTYFFMVHCKYVLYWTVIMIKKKEHKKLIKFCKTNDINIYWHVNDFKMLYLR